MDEQNNRELENYLARLEGYIKHLSVSERNGILLEIKDEILGAVSQGQSLDVVLLSLGSDMQALNRYLLRKNLPKAKNYKKRNLFLTIFSVTIGCLLVSILVIYLALRTYLPLYEIDSRDNILSLLGGHLNLFPDDKSFISKNIPGLNNVSKVELKGNIPYNSDFSKLLIKADRFQVRIKAEESNTISYRCLSYGDISQDYSTENSNQIILDFKKPITCIFKLPFGLEVNFVGNEGLLELDKLEQEISATVAKGLVNFIDDKPLYKMNFEAESILKKGEAKYRTEDANFNANIIVKNGEIKIFPR